MLNLPTLMFHPVNSIWFSYGHVDSEDAFDISKGLVPFYGVIL